MRTSSVYSETPPKVDVSRRCGKNMLDYSMFLFRMVTTCCCSVTLPSWLVARKCCSRQVSSCVAQLCYLRNMRFSTRWLWLGLGGAPTSSDETHLHESRLYRARKDKCTPSTHGSSHLVLSLHVQYTLFLSPHFAQIFHFSGLWN